MNAPVCCAATRLTEEGPGSENSATGISECLLPTMHQFAGDEGLDFCWPLCPIFGLWFFSFRLLGSCGKERDCSVLVPILAFVIHGTISLVPF